MRMPDLIRFAIALLLLAFITPAYAFDWENLWSSPEQRAHKLLEKQEYKSLVDKAPNATWRGLGEYRQEDYAAAVKSFAQQRAEAEKAGVTDELERAGYNQANSHVKNAEYEQAIGLYEEILEQNPQHENALHNLDIAKQLLEQQNQQQQQQQDSQGDDQESADQHDQQSDGEQQSSSDKNESQDKNENDENAEEQNQDAQSSAEQSDEADQSDQSQSEQEAAEQDAQAANAMQAEQQRQADLEQMQREQMAAEQSGAPDQTEEARPLTEREQANEQWLRQIPDDPAGLLERKIQNRHLTDFPKVQDSDKPW